MKPYWTAASCVASVMIMTMMLVVSFEDHYKTLGLQRSASLRDIKQAFRKLALKNHPDKNPDDPNAEAKFIKIARAYEVLSDPVQRLNYDEGRTYTGSDGPRGQQQQHQQQQHWEKTFNFNFEEFFGGFDDNPHRPPPGSDSGHYEEHWRRHAESHTENVRRAQSIHADALRRHEEAMRGHEDMMRQHRESMQHMQQQQTQHQNMQQQHHEAQAQGSTG